MTTTNTAVAPHLDRSTAMRLAATEYACYLTQLRSLDADDWASHRLPGMGRARAGGAQPRHGRVRGVAGGATAPGPGRRRPRRGVHRRAHQPPGRGAGRDDAGRAGARYAEVGPAAAPARAAFPARPARPPLPVPQTVNGAVETWTIGFLVDVILTRDVWMHRVDTARATGRDLQLTADHDGVLVADVVAEWVARHGSACALTLTGPAGGRWRFGTDVPELELDAVEFCRIVSGRRSEASHALLDTKVPF